MAKLWQPGALGSHSDSARDDLGRDMSAGPGLREALTSGTALKGAPRNSVIKIHSILMQYLNKPK